MALGTLTKTSNGLLGALNPALIALAQCAGDGAYPTGGTAAFQAKIRDLFKDSREVLAIIPQDCGGYVPCYDKAADKLKVYYADNNNASDGPLVEVPNATDLSAVTFKFLVISA